MRLKAAGTASGSCSGRTARSLDSVFFETRERNRHKSVGITLKRSFGGGGAAKVAKAD